MFSIDEPTADAIRHVLNESGELAAINGLRRHFPLIGDNAQARMCVRAIASWGPAAALKDVQARMKPCGPRQGQHDPRRRSGGRHRAADAADGRRRPVRHLPKYAPELNDIEEVWRDLKRHHLAHQTFTGADDLDHAIAVFRSALLTPGLRQGPITSLQGFTARSRKLVQRCAVRQSSA